MKQDLQTSELIFLVLLELEKVLKKKVGSQKRSNCLHTTRTCKRCPIRLWLTYHINFIKNSILIVQKFHKFFFIAYCPKLAFRKICHFLGFSKKNDHHYEFSTGGMLRGNQDSENASNRLKIRPSVQKLYLIELRVWLYVCLFSMKMYEKSGHQKHNKSKEKYSNIKNNPIIYLIKHIAYSTSTYHTLKHAYLSL